MAQDPDRPGPKPSWSESLKFMAQTGFLQSLQNFPKDTINEETVELMQPYFAMEDYQLKMLRRCAGMWPGCVPGPSPWQSFME